VSPATAPSRHHVSSKRGDSAVDTVGKQLTIRRISTVSVEFAAEKYIERVRKARPAKPLEQEKKT